jgi:hypothetical protein
MREESVVWPNFFIVGAPKCGTSSLYVYLSAHPQVFFPVLKEPHFFSLASAPEYLNRDHRWFYRCCGNRDEYNRIYESARGFPAIGDGSTSYLWDKDAAKRIYAVSPDAKIVIILRDPILRAHSHYLANHAADMNKASFMQEIRDDLAMENRDWWNSHLYVDLGMYCDQIRRYLDTFGRDNVLILVTEDLNERHKEVLSKLTQHLGIDPFPETVEFAETVHNPYRAPRAKGLYHVVKNAFSFRLRTALLPESVNGWLRNSKLLYSNDKPILEDEPRRLLQEIFEPEMRCVEKLLSRELPALRKSWK